MEIRVKYNILHPDYSGYNYCYGVEIGVSDDKNEYYPFFYDNLLTDGKKRININDLLTDNVLREKNIDYYIDKVTNQIVPVGLVDFIKDYGGKASLKIYVENSDELYKLDQIMQGIILAIKAKHRAMEIARKCSNNEVDIIK